MYHTCLLEIMTSCNTESGHLESKPSKIKINKKTCNSNALSDFNDDFLVSLVILAGHPAHNDLFDLSDF